MSLLTPLYIAAALAVSLPLLFHLIRRTPRGQFPFSSLMFLSPSPPRLTRKSRLDNLLLLLLRVTALVLLALAFARPFLREAAQFGLDEAGGRRVAILLDTSASMQRAGLWRQALARVDRVLDDLGPGDDVALFSFGAEVRTLVRFNEVLPGGGAPADPRQQVTRVRTVLRDLAPTWTDTDLGDALIAAADELHQLDDAKDVAGDVIRQIVLISDLQQGSHLEQLQGYEWPDDVQLAVQRVAPVEPTNAGLHLAGDLGAPADSTRKDRSPGLRVRVTNDRESNAEQFELRWAGEGGAAVEDDPISVYVPPGESRMVRVPRPVLSKASAADRLVLSGDGHPFDNTIYLVPLRQEEVTLLYIGSDAADDAQGLRYYFERAFPETPRRKVLVIARDPGQPLPAEDLLAARLIVVGEAVPEEGLAPLRQYIRGGGTVFCVLADVAAGKSLVGLLDGLPDGPDVQVEEAAVSDYAMLGEIAFTHPLFAALADPRFNDFTKIHFWKHRRVRFVGPDRRAGLSGKRDEPPWQVLARFDDGDPALFEQAQGEGRLLVLTSGWHPADSQLARSTKFVPLVSAVLERAGASDVVLSQYRVSDRVVLPDAVTASGKATVRKPDGTEVLLGSDADSFDETDRPGVYHLRLADPDTNDPDSNNPDSNSAVQRFAVNLAAAESKTAPLDVEELSQRGVRLGAELTRAELAEQRRQMRDVELENRQKLWRWLIVAALVVLIVETWLAGYLSASTTAGQLPGELAAEPSGVT